MHGRSKSDKLSFGDDISAIASPVETTNRDGRQSTNLLGSFTSAHKLASTRMSGQRLQPSVRWCHLLNV